MAALGHKTIVKESGKCIFMQLSYGFSKGGNLLKDIKKLHKFSILVKPMHV
jgi:hypothetical protein